MVTEDEAAATVAELRDGADRSTAYVREFTGLEAGERTAPVLVVDRPAWIQANADGFASSSRRSSTRWNSAEASRGR